jgi:hypothetical protein
MKIAYIAEREPSKKPTRKEQSMQAAILLASQLRHSLSSLRRSEKLFQAVLNEKATE